MRFANFWERSPELVPEPRFAYKCYTKPLKKEVLELIPDFFPESSRTSLSSVWLAGATPDTVPLKSIIRMKLVLWSYLGDYSSSRQGSTN